jgi:hypothetical protein
MVEEVEMMDSALAHERNLVGDSFWGVFRETFGIRRIFKRVCIGSSLFMFQNGAGVVRRIAPRASDSPYSQLTTIFNRTL